MNQFQIDHLKLVPVELDCRVEIIDRAAPVGELLPGHDQLARERLRLAANRAVDAHRPGGVREWRTKERRQLRHVVDAPGDFEIECRFPPRRVVIRQRQFTAQFQCIVRLLKLQLGDLQPPVHHRGPQHQRIPTPVAPDKVHCFKPGGDRRLVQRPRRPAEAEFAFLDHAARRFLHFEKLRKRRHRDLREGSSNLDLRTLCKVQQLPAQRPAEGGEVERHAKPSLRVIIEIRRSALEPDPLLEFEIGDDEPHPLQSGRAAQAGKGSVEPAAAQFQTLDRDLSGRKFAQAKPGVRKRQCAVARLSGAHCQVRAPDINSRRDWPERSAGCMAGLAGSQPRRQQRGVFFVGSARFEHDVAVEPVERQSVEEPVPARIHERPPGNPGFRTAHLHRGGNPRLARGKLDIVKNERLKKAAVHIADRKMIPEEPHGKQQAILE